MTRDFSASPPTVQSTDTTQRGDEIATLRLELMRQLQASLTKSHRAMLELDLASIRQATAEQAGLSRQLAELIWPGLEPPIIKRTILERAFIGRAFAGERAPVSTGCAPRLHAELKEIEREVRQALLLQSALLGRARHKLRVMANMLADPSRNYGPVPEKILGRQAASSHKVAE